MSVNSILCIDQSELSIDFSGQTIPIGSFITATQDANSDPLDNINYCFQITDVDQAPGRGFTATTNINYTSCYDCLLNNYSVVVFVDCLTSTIECPIKLNQLGYIPTGNSIFYMTLSNVGGRIEGIYTGCFYISQIIQVSQNTYDGYISANDFFTIDEIKYSNYSTCEECLNGFSAGTETNVCNVCWDGTGYTVSVVSNIPHPTWTNAQGQAVVQLNAITLGGPNGLNN